MLKKYIVDILAVLGILCLFIPRSEAADLYSAIYETVSSHNSDPTEADWITNAILYSSSTYNVDPILITAVMEAESGFNLNAGSGAGAIGLMQLMPETASAIGVDPYDPLGNVIGGTIYLSNQLANFSTWGNYSVTDAVAAYNAGPNAVLKYGGVPPYRETMNYVNNVASNYYNLANMIYQKGASH